MEKDNSHNKSDSTDVEIDSSIERILKKDFSIFSRRSILRGIAGAGFTGASSDIITGQAVASAQPESDKRDEVPPGADGGDSIVIENEVYRIDVGETESGFWIWPVEIDNRQTTTLYHELFALQAGDGDVLLSYNPTEIVERFPDNGQPGEKYSCIIRYELGGTELLVKRTVKMDESESTFTLKYDIQNVGSSTIDELNFYEHADFDNGSSDFFDDVGFYQASPEYVYTTDDGEYGGFSGNQPSENHHVGPFPAYDELRDGNLNNRDKYPETGSGDPVCILQWNLGTLEPNGTTSITLQYGGAFSQDGLERNVEQPDEIETDPPSSSLDLEFKNLRLVQTVENTRYDANNQFDTYDESQIDDATQFFDDPDSFVADKMAAVVFDVEGSPSTSNLPSDVEFEVRVGNNTGSVTLSRDDIVIPATQSQNTLLGLANDENVASNFPTFELEADASSVQVTLKNADTTISQQSGISRDIVDMPNLNVGFVGIQGDNVAYGGLNESDYDSFVDEAAQQFQSLYPTHRVNVVVADLSERYVSGVLNQPNRQPGNRTDQAVNNTHTTNGNDARDVIEDAITDSFTWGGLAPDDDSFANAFSIINGQKDTSLSLDDVNNVDFVVGVVPNDYFDEVSGAAASSGIHYSGGIFQPPAAGLVEIRSPSSAPHEGGHHFHGHDFYAQAIAQNNGNDIAHADDNLRSTKYNIKGGLFTSETAAPSYMSYGADEWMDTLAYNELLDDNISPTPGIGIDFEILEGLFALGEVTTDGIDIQNQSLVQNRSVTDAPDSDVVATVYGPGDDVLEERNFARGVTPAADGGGDFAPSNNTIFGTISLPDDGAYIEIVAPSPEENSSGTVSTTLNPYVDSLREALFAIPEEYIKNAYQGYTQSITNMLETVDRHVQNHRYRPAANVLEGVDNIVQEQVRSGYDTAPDDVLPKDTIRSMISFRVDRLRRLSREYSDNGASQGRGKE